jgi:hypothetical protein
MKKRINLFKKSENSDIVVLLKKINTVGLIINMAVFVVCLGLFILNLQLNNKLNQLDTDRQSLQATIAQQTRIQKKIDILSEKTAQLKAFTKEDAQSAKYYNLLKGLFESQNLPLFSSLKVTKNGIIEFGVDASSYDDLNTVLSYMESESFLQYFVDLKINRMSYAKDDTRDTFKLIFVGHIKDTNETT